MRSSHQFHGFVIFSVADTLNAATDRRVIGTLFKTLNRSQRCFNFLLILLLLSMSILLFAGI